MLPLLFLNPRFIRENAVATVLIAVIALGVGIMVMDWWKDSNRGEE